MRQILNSLAFNTDPAHDALADEIQNPSKGNDGMSQRLIAVATTMTALALAACGDGHKAEAQVAPETAQAVSMKLDKAPDVKIVKAVEADDDFDDLFAAEDAKIEASIKATDERIVAIKAENETIKAEIAADKAEIAADKAEIAEIAADNEAIKAEIAASLKRSAELLKGKTK